jgi:L,D-peptidoglycan transpeptidase YkuD (ErfK/YbiS/YcfS/YnhG family)
MTMPMPSHAPRLAALLLPLAVLAACTHAPGDAARTPHAWGDARQLVLVTTAGWDATQGKLRRFERDGSGWRQVGSAAAISVGRSGTAWGRGLHPLQSDGPQKREGDGKAPAGVFAIGTAFGYAPSADTRLAYQGMDYNDWCIDVPDSPLYNRIVDRSVAKAPGLDKSTEPMRLDLHAKGDQRYRQGFVIEHNADAVPGAGSCIFAHLWGKPGQVTTGCTAMSAESMQALLQWLDRDRAPVFALLPRAQHEALRAAWNLPAIPMETAR